MSEHMRVVGKVFYDHIPYREEGFSWCKHCKEYVSKMEVCFNEGWGSDWMQVNCGKCCKVIWVCNFLADPRKDRLTSKEELRRLKKLNKSNLMEELSGTRQFPKDDQKCFICKKKTNHYDCSSLYCGGPAGKKTRYICTNPKCKKEDERLHNIWAKKVSRRKNERLRKKS